MNNNELIKRPSYNVAIRPSPGISPQVVYNPGKANAVNSSLSAAVNPAYHAHQQQRLTQDNQLIHQSSRHVNAPLASSSSITLVGTPFMQNLEFSRPISLPPNPALVQIVAYQSPRLMPATNSSLEIPVIPTSNAIVRVPTNINTGFKQNTTVSLPSQLEPIPLDGLSGLKLRKANNDNRIREQQSFTFKSDVSKQNRGSLGLNSDEIIHVQVNELISGKTSGTVRHGTMEYSFAISGKDVGDVTLVKQGLRVPSLGAKSSPLSSPIRWPSDSKQSQFNELALIYDLGKRANNLLQEKFVLIHFNQTPLYEGLPGVNDTRVPIGVRGTTLEVLIDGFRTLNFGNGVFSNCEIGNQGLYITDSFVQAKHYAELTAQDRVGEAPAVVVVSVPVDIVQRGVIWEDYRSQDQIQQLQSELHQMAGCLDRSDSQYAYDVADIAGDLISNVQHTPIRRDPSIMHGAYLRAIDGTSANDLQMTIPHQFAGELLFSVGEGPFCFPTPSRQMLTMDDTIKQLAANYLHDM
ncbi:hypothetical protein HDU99_005299 [Rhizoclosmatium hyalinum]|nr:hypothetical protein HDU99_005299 [Rhizoclosmatium hyalinum]